MNPTELQLKGLDRDFDEFASDYDLAPGVVGRLMGIVMKNLQATPAAPPAREAEGIAIHGLKKAIYGDFDDASDLKSELVAIARELFYKGHTTLVTRIEECAKQVDVVAHAHAAKAVEHTRKVIVSDAVKAAVSAERQRLVRLVAEEVHRLESIYTDGSAIPKVKSLLKVRQWLTGDVAETK